MKLSIIIPCYNVEHFLGDTVNSIINQTDSLEYEVIAVDDGSRDNTYEVAKDVLKPIKNHLVISKSNGGVSSARNEGLRHASGEYVYFLDGDDILASSFFVQLNKRNFSSDVIYWNYFHERNAEITRQVILHSSQNPALEYLVGKLPIHMGSILFKRKMLSECHMLFDETTAYAEDREFIVKSLFYAKSYHFIDELLFTYKWRMGSAMRVQNQYTEKQFSGLRCAIRIYEFFSNQDDKNTQYASLNNLCISLLVHKRKVMNIPEDQYHKIIDDYIARYLPRSRFSLKSKFTLFVSIGKIIFFIDKRLLAKFIKVVF